MNLPVYRWHPPTLLVKLIVTGDLTQPLRTQPSYQSTSHSAQLSDFSWRYK